VADDASVKVSGSGRHDMYDEQICIRIAREHRGTPDEPPAPPRIALLSYSAAAVRLSLLSRAYSARSGSSRPRRRTVSVSASAREGSGVPSWNQHGHLTSHLACAVDTERCTFARLSDCDRVGRKRGAAPCENGVNRSTSTCEEDMVSRFEGRVALVAGAANGFGEAVARGLAARGASVALGGDRRSPGAHRGPVGRGRRSSDSRQRPWRVAWSA
jgi:hypothetical protein